MFKKFLAILVVLGTGGLALVGLLFGWLLMRLWGRRTIKKSLLGGLDPKEFESINDILTELNKKIPNLEAELLSQKQDFEQDAMGKRAVSDRLRASLEKSDHKIIELETLIRTKQFDALDETEVVGLYNPHYDFESSEKYKVKLDKIRDAQKQMVRSNKAVHVATEWTVEGSRAKGRAITKDMGRLMLRAFNGECDSMISKVKHSNIRAFETRIEKTFVAINKIGERFTCQLSAGYLELKIDELRVVHEFSEQKEFEREEQARIREQLREEQRAIREAAKAKKDAETEARRYSLALEKAQQQIALAQGAERTKFEAQILELQAQLDDAQQRGARAISQAELTRSGHVYIISNIGSFGENIYKIGMTRRLEPMDRVKELGDASVPFPFDLHAMIYSKDAPQLENFLHRHFRFRRLNMANHRKEFFQVNVEEIVAALPADLREVAFIANAEAREYRESLTLHQEIDAGRIPELFLRAEERCSESSELSLDDDPKELELAS